MFSSAEFILSLAVGGIFAAAAVPKLRRPKHFVVTVLAYHVLPPYVARLCARAIPPLELLIAVLLLSGVAVRFATLIAICLLLAFMVAVAVNLLRGRHLECGCFGASRKRSITWWTLIEDAVLASAAAAIASGVGASSWFGLAPWSPARFATALWAPALSGPTDPVALMLCFLVAAGAVVLLQRSGARVAKP